MKVLVVGLGRAGRRYAEHLRALGHEVGAHDSDPAWLAAPPPPNHDRHFVDVTDGLRWADAVVIAAPPETHLGYIEQCLIHGKPGLVEKPLFDLNQLPPEGWLYADTALIMPVTSYRFHPGAQQIKSEYRGGDIRVRYVDTEEAWRGDTYERSDLEQRIHFVDL
jgi:predicted dehydrogenase